MADILPIRQQALGAQVADELRRLIVTGRYAPGTSLVEGRLADQFNLSRGPIRDALKVLNAEGLVSTDRRNGRSATVVGLTSDDIDELFSLRGSLEELALKLGLAQDRPRLSSELREPLERMRQARQDHDPDAFTVADVRFHSVFYEVAGHRRLADVWGQYRPTIEVLLLMSNERYEDLGPSVAAHELLARLIETGEPDAVLAELRHHLDNARRRLREPFADAP